MTLSVVLISLILGAMAGRIWPGWKGVGVAVLVTGTIGGVLAALGMA